MNDKISVLNVLIDTSVLRQDPTRRKAGFDALKLLSSRGNIQLYIPYVVAEEFCTHQCDEYRKTYSGLSGKLKNFSKLPIPKDLKTAVLSFQENLEKFEDEIVDHPRKEFYAWVDTVRAIILPIAPSHGQRVMNDYFAAKPPFKSLKNRNDIPDSFIWQAAIDLVDDKDLVFVIAADNGFKNASEKVQNIRTFTSIDHFLELDVCKKLLREATVARNLNIVQGYLWHEARSIRDKLENLIFTYSFGDIDHYIHPLIGYDYDVLIEEVIVNNLGNIDLNYPRYYGNGIFVLDFEIYLHVQFSYKIFKGGDEVASSSASIEDWDDYYYRIVDVVNVMAQASATMKVQNKELNRENFSQSDLPDLVDTADFNFDSINNFVLL